MKKNKRKKNVTQGDVRQYIVGLLFLILLFGAAVVIFYTGLPDGRGKQVEAESEPTAPAGQQTTQLTPEPLSEEETAEPTSDPEEDIYSFLQGPRSWNNRIQWSGEWGELCLDGGSFGGFGCGLCCMANIYSSLTPYQCSPVDMYRYTQKHTYYEGGAAIAWGYMRQSLSSLGFSCKVKKKPASYQAFQKQVARSESCIMLISSQDAEVYWKDTPGHYVTVFLYDEEEDTVFLADSGDPDHNRKRISLKKIYRSLKTASEWQYLQVTDYRQEKDSWRHKRVTGNWVQ